MCFVNIDCSVALFMDGTMCSVVLEANGNAMKERKKGNTSIESGSKNMTCSPRSPFAQIIVQRERKALVGMEDFVVVSDQQ